MATTLALAVKGVILGERGKHDAAIAVLEETERRLRRFGEDTSPMSPVVREMVDMARSRLKAKIAK